ncbi:hypothetical protein [Mesorhizobium sp. B2-3-5]|uniref:hypothetical protein n=1 Tax=Mesorhizobium sp. B2-3-5 TaxID=2589958 RepID=UPI00112B8355|nr:hypothetical protein [Mesorhizobium sp. B2-3-5]TPM24202.1 hypothetical protein FJ958_23630 [Mesorhizobium sp. B2-3-5]
MTRDRFSVDAINAFITRLVNARTPIDTDTAGARQLKAAIQAIKDKTVNSTVTSKRHLEHTHV